MLILLTFDVFLELSKMLHSNCLFRLTLLARLLIHAVMGSLSKYWARLKAVVCIAVACGVFLLPVPSAHAEVMNNSAIHDMSAALSGDDHQNHSVGSDIRTVIFDATTNTTDNHHDEQCCPANCLSVMLSDPFIAVSPEKSNVQVGLKSHGLTSADVSGILRPPLT